MTQDTEPLWHQRFAQFYSDLLKASANASQRTLTDLGKLFSRGVACDLAVLGVSLEDAFGSERMRLDLRALTDEDLDVESDDLDEGASGAGDSLPSEPTEETQDLFGTADSGMEEAAAVDPTARRRPDIRAARKIQRTQAQDPYNRETLVGGPVLRARKGGKVISGPLLYWNVELEYDPGNRRLTVLKRSDIPELNTAFVEAFLSEDEGIAAVVEEAQKLLLADDFGLDSVPKLLRVIGGLVDELEGLDDAPQAEQPMRSWLYGRTDERFSISPCAVLVNAPRSNAHLLEDLRVLATLGAPRAGGPMDLLTRAEDLDSVPDAPEYPYSFSEAGDAGTLLHFPFESNPVQRKVASLSDSCRILTVQGPPGTGKSHTIANLVCHLASTGRSVLVTSHQRKAIEVVTALLRPLRGLALSMAAGDRQSSQELRQRVEGFLQDESLVVQEAEREVRSGEKAVERLDRELRLLARRFQELRQREHEGWDGFHAFADLRKLDHIAPEDDPPDELREQLPSLLQEWCRARLAVGASYDEVARLLCPVGEGTTGAVEHRAHANLQDLIELATAVRAAPPSALLRRVRELLESPPWVSPSGEAAAAQLLDWLAGDASRIVDLAPATGWTVDNLPAWRGAAEAATAVTWESLHARGGELLAHLERDDGAESTVPVLSDVRVAARLRESSATLKKASQGFLRWHLAPAARKARRVTVELLGAAPDRAGFGQWAADLEGELARLKCRNQIRALVDELGPYLPPGAELMLPAPEEGRPGNWLSAVRRLYTLIDLMRVVRRAPAEEWMALANVVLDSSPGGLDRQSRAHVEGVLRAVHVMYGRARRVADIREGTPLSDLWKERVDTLLDEVAGGALTDRGGEVLRQLEGLVVVGHPFRRLRTLERGELSLLRRTLANLEVEIAEDGGVPEWVQHHVPAALEAHRLHRLITGDLGADPDDVASVTAALRKGQRTRLQYVAALVERRHRLRQATARQNPRTRAELQRVKRLLGMSGRMKKSLVTLRSDIDYAAVLGAFPVWLATIDDVCRLFPATSEIFDYIIVDEASQCAQPALLPLAHRARKLIVVGDREQLRPSFARFLPASAVEALLEKHQLHDHRAGIFVAGRESLLDYAEFRAQGQPFLNEHFRSDPTIIAWSNHRIYGGRLRVLTHRRANSFRPALQVRSLRDADDDPGAKVNHTEAEAVVRELRRLVSDPRHRELTMGVISPFRKQADRIQALIEREFEGEGELLNRHRITASTVDGFQGDERDIILYSFRIGPSTNPNTLGVLERERERFNVAFSRARRLAISFVSSPISRLPKEGANGAGGHTRSWIEHSLTVASQADGQGPHEHEDRFDSEFERSVCEQLRSRGLDVVTQQPCGPYRIDLAIRDAEGRELGVECDGSWKFDEFGNLRPEDYQRQDLIERAGWVLHRISGRKYLLDPGHEIQRTMEVLARQPTLRDREIMTGDAGLDDTLGSVDPGTLAEQSEQSEPDGREDRLEPVTASDDSVGAGDGNGLVAAPDDESAPRLEQVVFGQPISRIGQRLRDLIRWTLLGNARVQTNMFDRLIEIDDRLQAGADLSARDIAALEFAKRMAEQQGFELNEGADSALGVAPSSPPSSETDLWHAD